MRVLQNSPPYLPRLPEKEAVAAFGSAAQPVKGRLKTLYPFPPTQSHFIRPTMPTLLIVRPAAQAAADRQTCTAAGWQGSIFSPFAIEADADALARLSGQFQTASAVFWVSPSAVAVAAPHLEFSDRSPPQIAVGGSSARALQAYSRTPVWFPDDGNDSEAVLRLPLWQTLPQGAAVLIVRGRGGREFLAHQLTLRGFNVQIAEVYFRRPLEPDWTQFAAAPPDAAWITSAESVRLLFAAAPPPFTQKLQSLLYFTHHQRVAEALRAAGATRVELIPALDIDILNRYAEQNR